jgi:hypothetical protein
VIFMAAMLTVLDLTDHRRRMALLTLLTFITLC